MPAIARRSGGNDSIELAVVQRAATPEGLLKLGIQLHACGLSLSNTSRVLEGFGVDRTRSTIHNWVQKAERQPAAGTNSAHVAVDETVIQLNISGTGCPLPSIQRRTSSFTSAPFRREIPP